MLDVPFFDKFPSLSTRIFYSEEILTVQATILSLRCFLARFRNYTKKLARPFSFKTFNVKAFLEGATPAPSQHMILVLIVSFLIILMCMYSSKF